MPPGASNPRDTPAMRQYLRFKSQHPDCLLFFRIGDFYEMFDDDAVKASRLLGLTLTQRTEGIPMAGAPFHQLENYLRKATELGLRVAVCDQIQDAAEAKLSGDKAIIERAVTRILTPGTLVDDALLDAGTPRTLAAVCFTGLGDDSHAASAVCDLSTGRFDVFESSAASLIDDLARRHVSELLYCQSADASGPPKRVERLLAALNISGTPQPGWHFRPDEALESLVKLYSIKSLAGFGLNDDEPVVFAAGALVRYLESTQLPGSPSDRVGSGSSPRSLALRSLSHLQPPRKSDPAGVCVLDATTLRSLEVLRTIRAAPRPGVAADTEGSLLGVFSSSRTFPGCQTAMGKRLLRDWLCTPLSDRAAIMARQNCVATLVEDRRFAADVVASLEPVQDIARIAGRLALGRATPRDLVALGKSLAQVVPVAASLDNAPAFATLRDRIMELAGALAPIAQRIALTCVDSPPPHLREGGLIRDGVDPALDDARRLQRDAASWMADYQARLIATHDLPSLKVGYNKVFGYYIELPAAQSRRAPDQFTRKQTLKSAERYITPELKEFELAASTAESRALGRELAIFDELCAAALALVSTIARFADACAELDVLACFAEKAARRSWVRPELIDEPALVLHQARHPVLDELLGSGFVPNDVELGLARASAGRSASAAPLAIITGPNMAGKSTYIRTAALLTLLAHTGSFLPCDRATVGITDRIFTRVGADDALHAGQSTFMVEMTETARILNHATLRSLIILDEIGRGTSTLDGLSLAWAIAETLARAAPSDHAVLAAPRTLFATHYHELTELEDLLPERVRNLHVSVREWGDDIVFLHRILPGRTDRSYGIHVAKLAGLPASTIARAREVLSSLAVQHQLGSSKPAADPHVKPTTITDAPRTRAGRALPPPAAGQLPLFTEYLPHPAVNRLRELKLDTLTPLAAFDALRDLQAMIAPAQQQSGSAEQ
jgi:DNA mismatch repair protein MutS